MLPVELSAWAARHGVTAAALAELSGVMGALAFPRDANEGGSEARVQSQIRLAAPAAGMRLFRNNVGVLSDDRGVPVRYGLANDTQKLNEAVKSSDLIGWRRLVITQPMVGHLVAQFVGIECKHAGWAYSGDDRERAQLAWGALINADGGYAKFATSAGDI